MRYLNKKRVYKTKPSKQYGWTAYDVGRDTEQALRLAGNYPKDMLTYVVKTGVSRGKKRHTFPYTIYVKE